MSTRRSVKRRKIFVVQLVAVLIIDILIAGFVLVIADSICGNDINLSLYMKMLFIPLLSFVCGFASLVFSKNLGISVLANLITCAVIFVLTNEIGISILLWLMLYMILALPGYGIALAARSYRSK